MGLLRDESSTGGLESEGRFTCIEAHYAGDTVGKLSELYHSYSQSIDHGIIMRFLNDLNTKSRAHPTLACALVIAPSAAPSHHK